MLLWYSNAYESGRFTTPEDGLYFFTYTLIWYSSGTRASLRPGIQNINPPAIYNVINIRSNAAGLDGISSGCILQLTASQQLWMQSDYDTNAFYGDGYTVTTSWGGFELSNIMHTVVAFEVVSFYPVDVPGLLSFDETIVNANINGWVVGNGWDENTSTYTALYFGTYYFGLSALLRINFTTYGVALNVSSGSNLPYCEVAATQVGGNDGIDTISRRYSEHVNAVV